MDLNDNCYQLKFCIGLIEKNILLRQLQWERRFRTIRRPRKQRLNITMFLASEVWLHLGGG
ncbi:hypothetical protein WP5W18E02_36640 [Aeromonas caviae]|nr:hypothetical protein WP5W18E02_36640 [Aeromonas caviae]